MAKSNLITTVNFRGRVGRLLRELVDALNTSTGHRHDGADARVPRNVRALPTLTNITTVGNVSYTATQIAGGVITRDPAGGGRTDTTPTAANLIGGSPALSNNGDCITCLLINTADAAEAITLAGGSGVTMANVGQTLGQNEAALLVFRRTSGSAVTCYIVGA